MDKRQYTAIHEAGHAVVDTLLSVPFECISMLPRYEDFLGFSQLAAPSCEDDEALAAYLDNFTIGGFAGGLAGWRYILLKEPDAVSSAGQLMTFVLDGCKKDLELICRFRTEFQKPMDGGTLLELAAKAERLVIENWEPINWVALELKVDGELTAQRVQEITKRFSA
jgi:hypothetical protein